METNNKAINQYIKKLENPGVDPGTSSVLSGRSTI